MWGALCLPPPALHPYPSSPSLLCQGPSSLHVKANPPRGPLFRLLLTHLEQIQTSSLLLEDLLFLVALWLFPPTFRHSYSSLFYTISWALGALHATDPHVSPFRCCNVWSHRHSLPALPHSHSSQNPLPCGSCSFHSTETDILKVTDEIPNPVG